MMYACRITLLISSHDGYNLSEYASREEIVEAFMEKLNSVDISKYIEIFDPEGYDSWPENIEEEKDD